MKAVRVIVVSLLLLLGLASNADCKDSQNFSESDRVSLLKQIDAETAKAYSNTMSYQAWAMAFKITLFALALGAALSAAWSASFGSGAVPTNLKIANVFLTTATVVISTFATSEFNLAGREAIWEKKYRSLQECGIVLRYQEPNKPVFMTQLGKIWNWGDFSNISEMTEMCDASARPAGASPSSAHDGQADHQIIK